MCMLFLLIIGLLGVKTCSAAQSLLVHTDGKISSSANKILENAFQGDCDLVNLIDCSSSIGECKMANELFLTHFSPSGNGLALDKSGNGKTVVLKGSFDTMFSPSFCGSKLADYFATISNSIVVLLKTEDIKEVYELYDQLFRRIFFKFIQRGIEKGVLKVIIDSPTNSTKDLELYLQRLWDETKGKYEASSTVDIEVIPFDEIGEKKIPGSIPTIDVSKFVSEWARIPSPPRPILSANEEASLLSVELAYSYNLKQAEIALAQMQARLSDGKPILNLPARINRLLFSTLADFNRKVVGIPLVRERIDRSSSLRAFILSSAQKLFDQVIHAKEVEHTRLFQKELAQIYSKYSSAEDSSSQELLTNAVKQLLRKRSFDFKVSLADAEAENLGMVVSDALVTDFTEKLSDIAKAFPETAEARLIELRKTDQSVQRPQRKKKRKFGGIGFNLSLVGMLRPPGYGNLQGFAGYSTSLLGVPVDFLLGVQNDGDSVEILGEDREHPFLRLQPKIHFDIDLQ